MISSSLVVAVREHADVAAEAHLHAGIERGLEGGALARDARRLGVNALLPSGVLRGRIAGRNGRTIRHALLHHQLPDLRRTVVTMLDGVDAAHDRAAHP